MKKIALTPGEPAGIGIDLAILTAKTRSQSQFVVFADPDVLRQRAKQLGKSIEIIAPDQVAKDNQLALYEVKTKATVKAGQLDSRNAFYVLKTLDLAIDHCLSGNCHALLTGPVHKGVINQAGITFSGHTEYLAKKTNKARSVMMLSSDKLNVTLATTHLPLKSVSQAISKKVLEETIVIIDQHFKKFHNKKNIKIWVCGLNPHAGEQGYLGDEEINIIEPTINKLRAQGYNLSDVVPADSLFCQDFQTKSEVILSMYHDQGLAPFKALSKHRAANITLGLPILRASVDHGSALSLAATGRIDLTSFEFALAYLQDRIT